MGLGVCYDLIKFRLFDNFNSNQFREDQSLPLLKFKGRLFQCAATVKQSQKLTKCQKLNAW